MHLHAKVPLHSFLHLVHLRITRLLPLLGRTWGMNECGVHHHTFGNQQPLSLKESLITSSNIAVSLCCSKHSQHHRLAAPPSRLGIMRLKVLQQNQPGYYPFHFAKKPPGTRPAFLVTVIKICKANSAWHGVFRKLTGNTITSNFEIFQSFPSELWKLIRYY